MVSKRQKLARKRFKEEHPELVPKPEPTPPKDPSKKKKKNGKFKRKKKSETVSRKNLDKPNPKSLKKRLLRVPGLKPGEACFICKEKDHIAKDCPEKAEWQKNKICLLCRHRGHTLRNCPNKRDETVDRKLCYNCGETGHSLSQCPQPVQDGGTKYASCFICKDQGHLSKNCPKSTHGIYPKGGCCKVCGGVTHLARDCPNRGYGSSFPANGGVFQAAESEANRRGQVTKLVSGDDLDDDFMVESNIGSESGSSKKKAHVGAEAKDSNASQKKKKGPKVVNFVG